MLNTSEVARTKKTSERTTGRKTASHPAPARNIIPGQRRQFVPITGMLPLSLITNTSLATPLRAGCLSSRAASRFGAIQAYAGRFFRDGGKAGRRRSSVRDRGRALEDLLQLLGDAAAGRYRP